MSTTAIREFFNHLYENNETQQAYWEEINASVARAAADFAAARGFDFSVDDLQRDWAERSAELGEAELDAVAGGLGGHSLRTVEMTDRIQQIVGQTGIFEMAGRRGDLRRP